MKKIFLLLFLAPFFVSCGSHVDAISRLSAVGFTNSIYSSGSEVTWKGNEYIVSVHDGDTFTTKSGINIRLFGVDTAEMSKRNRKNNKWTDSHGIELLWAKRARDYVFNLINNKNVTVIYKGENTYNRSIGSLYYLDENKLVRNLAFELVRKGLARKAYISTKVKYYQVPKKYYWYISNLQRFANINKVGIWSNNWINQKKIFPKWNIVS